MEPLCAVVDDIPMTGHQLIEMARKLGYGSNMCIFFTSEAADFLRSQGHAVRAADAPSEMMKGEDDETDRRFEMH